MRKRIPLLVAFFMVLYIGSIISIPTYVSSTIPAQPNMTKEFSESAYLDESPYSLDGFSETLGDDVFYTPDGFYDDTPVTASQGYGDWADSIHFNDSQYWSSFDTIDEYALFRGDHSIEGFEYSIYGRALSANGNVTVYDTMIQDQYVLEEMVVGSDAWYNGTYWGTNYEPTQVYLILEAGTGGVITIDYIELRFYYLPLYDYSYATGYTNWGESFTNVSDWSIWEGNGLSTDNDAGYFEGLGDNAFDRVYTDSPTLTGSYYLEIRVKSNVTNTYTYVYGFALDGHTGTTQTIIANIPIGTTWATYKVLVNLTTIESVAIIAKHLTSDFKLEIDYLRISPADEMGWQHDGSTTEGTIGLGSTTFSVSSDNDILTVNTTSVESVPYWDTYQFLIDATSTKAEIETTYYQFLEVRWRCTALTAGLVYLDMYADDYAAYALSGYHSSPFDWVTERFNMKAFTTEIVNQDGLCIMTYSDAIGEYSVVEIDYIKAYSIANYTVTQSTVGINEYAYVAGGELHFNLDGDSDYILLNHDPAISVDSTTYNRWILDIDNVGSGTSHTDDFGIDFYVGAWLGYTYDETNSTMPTGTTTDFRIISYDAYSLQSIVFWDAHTWHVVDSETIYFDLPEWHLVELVSIIIWLEIVTWALDVFLILLGMFMVPASTLYLVKGGKDNMSMDKVFYFIVAFLFGWGLIFIGVS